MRNPFARSQTGRPGESSTETSTATYVRLDPGAIESAFVAPKWLRDIGLTSWFAVGAAVLLVLMVAIVAITATITIPVILAAVVAAVASPIVGFLQRHGVPRGIGTILFVLLVVAIVAFVFWAVLAGISSQAGKSSDLISQAMQRISDWAAAHGLDAKTAEQTSAGLQASTKDSVQTLLHGVKSVIGGLTGLAFFLAMTFISLIFLLKDGPTIRQWGERHMGVPVEAAQIITGRLIGSLRGYFVGVTIIALFNAAVVGLGAWILGVPLIATIMLVTFIGAYIPFLGAWAAGAFSVLIALGAGNETAVVGMIIVQLLANGMLQQVVQPIAYGAALGIHPLAALIATIGGGCLFGSIGLILGAPMLSAAVRISADLANARAEGDDGAAPAESPPIPPDLDPAPA